MSDLPPIRPAESAGSPSESGGRDGWLSGTLATLVLAKEALGGMGVSMAVHGVLLLAMALWVVNVQNEGSGVSLSLLPGVAQDATLEEIQTAAELAGSSPPLLDATPIEMSAIEMEGPKLEPLTASQAAGIADGTGSGTGEGDGAGDDGLPETIQLSNGGTAIRKGSFTVWTIPPDPRPLQGYMIVIEVELPKDLRLRRYPKRDLYGEVKGTDSYRSRLPGNTQAERSGYLPIRNGKVQLIVGIPGAESLVKDRIKVGSKLLKESQTLELVF